MIKLKLRSVGKSTAIIFPKEVTERLKIKSGDTIYLTESAGGYRLTSCHPDFNRQMTAAESIMRRYKRALKQLAK